MHCCGSMRWPPPRSVIMGFIAGISLVCLVAFHATSRADSTMPLTAAEAAAAPVLGPEWVPEVNTAPGLPVQCADGAWTRTVVRGGCAKHGGVAR